MSVVGMGIACDPKRSTLGEALASIYSRYHCLRVVRPLYRRNPAIAFNEAARLMNVDIFVGIAGDLYIGERELERLIGYPRLKNTVYCVTDPLQPRRHFAYPEFWKQRYWPFISGLFWCERQMLLNDPMPESPDFQEDLLWERDHPRWIFVGINVPCAHLDNHRGILRWRFIQGLIHGWDMNRRFRRLSRFRSAERVARTILWELDR